MNQQVNRVSIPQFNEQKDYLFSAVSNNQLVTGPHLDILEKRLKALFDVKHVILTGNCFGALLISLMTGEGRYRHVLTSAVGTCFAIVNAIKAAGAAPCFVDVGNACDMSIKESSEDYRSDEAIIAPNLFGVICPMIKNKMSRFVIEDSAQAFLSRSVMNTKADVIALSFYPSKVANGIDGGAILTNSEEIASRAKRLVRYTDQKEYEEKPRYNYKMANINAAFALGTLENLDFLRAKIMNLYQRMSGNKIWRSKGLEVIRLIQGEAPSKFMVLCQTKDTRNKLLEHLITRNVDACKELVWLAAESERSKFPNAKKWVEQSLSIPFHPLLSDIDLVHIETALESFKL